MQRRVLSFCAIVLPAVGFLAVDSAPQATSNSSASGPIRFEETAAKAGLRYVTATDATDNKNQPQTMVAGVALFDYDGDGYLDIYLVGGAAIPSLVKTGPEYWNRLYHNNQDGTFTDVTEKLAWRAPDMEAAWRSATTTTTVGRTFSWRT